MDNNEDVFPRVNLSNEQKMRAVESRIGALEAEKHYQAKFGVPSLRTLPGELEEVKYRKWWLRNVDSDGKWRKRRLSCAKVYKGLFQVEKPDDNQRQGVYRACRDVENELAGSKKNKREKSAEPGCPTCGARYRHINFHTCSNYEWHHHEVCPTCGAPYPHTNVDTCSNYKWHHPAPATA